AYQMGSHYSAAGARVDPENRLLWRFRRRRLEIEAIRDSMLAVAGTLDRTQGGSLLATPNFQYVTNDQSANKAQYDAPRRSLYLPVIRNAVYDVFQIFDFVEPSYLNGQRATTVVPGQALFLMNGDTVLKAAKAFAEHLLSREGMPDEQRLETAYFRSFGRPARPEEIREATSYLAAYEARIAARQPDPAARRKLAWQSLIQALFSANEFIYLN
ncbi:MAG: DUF1553 domain-containing protein, partial [Armatimonadetes bacterium]|nr:DUF1553 domain-containing protein [Armatimonadota bacterium]